MSLSKIYARGKTHLDLASTKVSGSFVHSFCSFSVEQVFRNQYNEVADCELFVNGGVDFVVYNIRIVSDGKVTEFKLNEIDADADVDQPGDPFGSSFSNSTKESSDALHLLFGEVPPGGDVIVTFDCSLVASQKTAESMSVVFPSTGAGTLDFDIAVKMYSPVQDIQTTLATTEVASAEQIKGTGSKEETTFTVTFADPIESIAIQRTLGDESFIGLAIAPQIASNSEVRSEVFLVIDCSGSMSGSRINFARQTLLLFLKSLPSTCFFNIIRFGSAFEKLFPNSVEYNEENYRKAFEMSSTLNANLGGTDLLSPLDCIFHEPVRPGYARQVFLMTDGEVEHSAECLALATANRKNHRIFSVGIGHDLPTEFLEEIARSTMGTSAFVSTGNEVISATMKQLGSSLRPAVVDVQIHVEGVENVEIAPFPVPTLFTGWLTHVYIKCPPLGEETAVMVTGLNYEDSLVCETVDGINLDKSFGFLNIHDIEEKITLAKEEDLPALRVQAVAISKQRGFASQFTAMYSVVDGVEQTTNQSRSKQQSNRPNATQPPQQSHPKKASAPSQRFNARQMTHQTASKKRSMGRDIFTNQANTWGNSQAEGQQHTNWSAKRQRQMSSSDDDMPPQQQMDAMLPQPQMDAMLPQQQMDAMLPQQQMDAMLPQQQMNAMLPQQQMDAMPPQQQMDAMLLQQQIFAMPPQMNARPQRQMRQQTMNAMPTQRPQWRPTSSNVPDSDSDGQPQPLLQRPYTRSRQQQTTPATQPGDLMSILLDQTFQGSWAMSEEQLLTAIGATKWTCEETAEAVRGSVLVLAYLESKQKDSEAMWKIAHAKAMCWLQSTNAEKDWPSIIAATQSTIVYA